MKRGIAGSLIFGVFDKHAIIKDIFKDDFSSESSRGRAIDKWVKNITEVNGAAGDTTGLVRPGRDIANGGIGERNEALKKHLDYLYSTPLKYSDEVPPFNITITFVNANGAASTMSIYGVQLINETQAFTMDDMTNDLNVTYVARDIDPLMNLAGATFTS